MALLIVCRACSNYGMYKDLGEGGFTVGAAFRSLGSTPRRRRCDGQGMVEFALIFPVFIFLILGGILLFMWELYNASAQFVVQEATYVAGYSASGATYTATAEAQAVTAIHESMLAAVDVSPHHLVYACPPAAPPKVAYKMFLCATSATSGTSTVITVTISGWMPSPTPIPVIGQLLPVNSTAQATIQGFA